MSQKTTSLSEKGNDFLKVPLSDRARQLKVLLLEPLCSPDAIWGSTKVEQGFLPPLGMISVYSWLKYRGYNIFLIDTQFGDYTAADLSSLFKQEQYDLIAMPVYTTNADFAFQTARLAKETLPECKIVMGNVHVTALPELSMSQCPELDFIIRHEAEYTLDELLCAVADGCQDWSKINGLVYRDNMRIVINPPRNPINDLDELPKGFFADLELLRYVPHPTQYITLPNYPFVTQRGCPYSCAFCNASLVLGKKTRFYSPERVVEELKILTYEKGAKGIYFQDSTFTINRKYSMKLMELLITANLGLTWLANTRADRVDPELLDMMFKAGGRKLIIGIESANQESLDLVEKRTTVEKQTQGIEWIRKAGFRYVTSFIICLPGENDEMVRKTIQYSKDLKAEMSMFYLPVPYPGTRLYEICKQEGTVRTTTQWSDYLAVDFNNPVYINPNFGVEGMQYWYKRAFLEFYGSPSTWWENIRNIQGSDDFIRLLRGGRALITMTGNGVYNFVKQQYHGFHGQAAPLEDCQKDE